MGFFLTYRIRTGSSMALEKDRIIKDTVTKGILVLGEAVAATVSAIAIPADVSIVPRKSGSRDTNMYILKLFTEKEEHQPRRPFLQCLWKNAVNLSSKKREPLPNAPQEI